MNCNEILQGDIEEIIKLALYEEMPKVGKQVEIYGHAMNCPTCGKLFYEKLNDRFYSDKEEKLSLQTYYKYAEILRELNLKSQQ